MTTIERVKKELIEASIFGVDVRVVQNGIQARKGGVVVTFYYKRYKYVVNTKKGSHGFKSELDVICKEMDTKPKVIDHYEQVVHTEEGVQLCIDHILKKAELMDADKTRDNNRIVLYLRILTHELKQYL